MKNGTMVGAILGIALVAALFAIPALAQGPGDDSAGEGAFERMVQSCGSGDWDAMTDAAEEFYGASFDSVPCSGWGSSDSGDEIEGLSSQWQRGCGGR